MSPSRTLLLGTRRSSLAMAQSRGVAESLEAAHPGLTVELVPIVTEGDRRPGDLAAVGGKGLFTRELEERLLHGDLDLAVHSLKDLPVTLPDGLEVAALPGRADPRDVLVSEVAADLASLAAGAVLLTGSLRRRAQILAHRPDLRVEPVRGNVETRVRKWRQQKAAGVILAAAGLSRLGLDDLPAHPLDPEVVVPAPGQGILAVEVRGGSSADELCRALDDASARRCATAERVVVRAFGGDCTLPLAAWARELGTGLRLTAVLAIPDGTDLVRAEVEAASPEQAGSLAEQALRQRGAERILARLAAAP